ncbi:PAS domain-containing sensor histidine kinase [Paenibacillus rigui]|nr:PAS domain-containing sensor histidine kinase [Paenibacillus rigui]
MNQRSNPPQPQPIHTAPAAGHSLHQSIDLWFTISMFGMALLHLDGRFVKANAAMTRLLGYGEPQLTHMNIQALLHPDELLHSMHKFSELAGGTTPSLETEMRWIHNNGDVVWCLTHVTLLKGELEEPCFLLQVQDQTEKRNLAAAFQNAMQTYHSLIESVPYSLFMIDLDWKLTFLNQAAEQTLGQEKEQIIGQSLWARFPNVLHSAFYRTICRAMEEKVPTYLHAYYASRERWYEMTAHPTKEGLCLFIRDTTELKQQESAYQETKLQLDSMIEHSPDPISILDLQYHMIQMNPAYLETFGFTEQELLGRRPLIIPEDLMAETEELFLQASMGFQIKGFETKRLHKSGALLDILLSISPVKNAEHRVVAICVILRDISESKKMEQSLRKSEENYRIIAENTTDLILLLDPQGVIQYASPSHKTLLQLDPYELIGHKPYEFWGESALSQATDCFYHTIRNKESLRLEVTLPLSPGKSMLLEVHGVPVTGPDDQVETVVIVSRDISERKQAEDLLRRSEKLSVAGQLAAGIAHEIRNPLTALKGFTQFMQKSAEYKEEYLKIMLDELTRIEHIISELLMLAKPQSVQYRRCRVEPILHDVVSLLESQANLKNVIIEVEPLDKHWTIYGEENQVKQVFINLLKNAMDAMPSGGYVRIIARKTSDGMLSIDFADEGEGIPPEQLERLGEPFYTTKESGSGLGLMISQKMLNEHGGTLRIASEPGRGTTVTVLLPFA